MKKEKRNITRLGFFVLATLLVFMFAVYNIGSQENLFGSTFQLSSIFHNVNGLKPGNNVRYAGINVGSVRDIVIVNDSTLRVDMVLERKVKEFLKKDAVASIGSDGLVGNMIVNISPGEGGPESVEDGDVISSYSRVKTEDMMVRLSQTNENIALLSYNLLEIVQDINEGKGSLYALINDSLMAANLRLSMANLRRTTRHLNMLSDQFQTSLKKIDEGKGVLGYLLHDTTFEQQINKITQSLDTLVRERTNPILNNLEQSSKDLMSTTSELKLIIDEVNLNEGLVGAILKDSTIATDLKLTMENLNNGTELFTENMEAMRENFLFRRYFKKQEKQLMKEQRKKEKKSLP